MRWGYWTRFRPRATTDLDELRSLLEEQASKVTFQARHVDAMPAIGSNAHPRKWSTTSWRRVREIGNRISERVQYPVWKRGGYDDVPMLHTGHPVSLVSMDPIFPPTWRNEAVRGFMPDELAQQFQMWREWLVRGKEERYRAFLTDLYIHESSLELHVFWRKIRAKLRREPPRHRAWATQGEFHFLRDLFHRLPKPEIDPAPDADLRFRRPTGDEEERLAVQVDRVESWKRIVGEWNQAVAGNFELYPNMGSLPTFKEYLARFDAKPIHEFVEWGFLCVHHGMGLSFHR